MRILISPDKFKGSLTAAQAAAAIGRGFSAALPDAEIRALPIADGGEGTAEAICSALRGEWIIRQVRGPLGGGVSARYAWLDGGIAVIEMSEASGLWRVPTEVRDPLRASTFGTGELIADAVRRGAKKILIGLGGSATNDGGAGIAAALGFQFLSNTGVGLDPIPENLPAVARILVPENLSLPEITALCDVQNPLLGERGATRTYGPQKGAGPPALRLLESGLEHLAGLVARDLVRDGRDAPGAGAAGGTAFGLAGFCGAQIRRGFDTIADVLDLERAIAASDLIITGEGRLDLQTLEGKGPLGVAMLARKHAKRVIAFAGSLAADAPLDNLFDETFAIAPPDMSLDEAIRNAASLLEQCAHHAAQSHARRDAVDPDEKISLARVHHRVFSRNIKR